MITGDDAKAIARSIKVAGLRVMPLMDGVAVRLNEEPDYNEITKVMDFARLIESFGYQIVKKVGVG